MINQHISIGVLSVASALIAGCGSSNSGPAPLTADQKTEVGNTLASAVVPVSAGLTQGMQMSNLGSSSIANSAVVGSIGSMMRSFSGVAEVTPSVDVKTTMESRFADTTACTPTIQGVSDALNLQNALENADNAPSNLTALLQKGIDLKIAYSGANCPASFDAEMIYSATVPVGSTAGSVNGSFSVDYVAGPEFKSLNDVSEVHLKELMTGTSSSNSFNASASVSGSIISQQYGNISFNGQATVDNNGGLTMNFTLNYPGFTAVLTSADNGKKLLINGQDINQGMP